MPGRGGNIEIRANIHIDEDNGPINVPPLTKEPGLPQRGRIYKDEVLRHGMTHDCQGCKAVNRGTKVHGHSEKCRRRMEDILKNEGKARFEEAARKRERIMSERKRKAKDEDKNGSDEGSGQRISETKEPKRSKTQIEEKQRKVDRLPPTDIYQEQV